MYGYEVMLLLVSSQGKSYCTKNKLIPSFYQIIIILVGAS